MKIFLVSLLLFTALLSNAQSLVGAWEMNSTKDGRETRTVVIFSEKHQVATEYDAESGAFIGANGGTWRREGNAVTEGVEFDTRKPERIGTEVSFEIEMTNDQLSIVGGDRTWKRIDDGLPGALAGAWLINSRIKDGLPQSMDTSSPRKTMKILSGTRFQWIAYNIETKQFLGTGGGTYTTENGKYTENIEFFSRDDSRVGGSLKFNFEMKYGDWIHTGKSSKGQLINETWGRRE